MAERAYYIDGNAVRQPASPDRQQQLAREAEAERQKESRRKAARENRKRARAIKTRFMAFVSVSVAAIAAAAVVMIQSQSSVTASMKRVANLEGQVNELRAENDAKYNEIITSVDLSYIKSVAIDELGMSYATEDQIEYYTVDKSNFMDQYSDIPR